MHMRAVLFFILIPLRAEAAKDCYWADGQSLETTNTPGYAPCYPNADVSHCCQAGEACLANGLCFGANIGHVCLTLVFLNTQHIFEMLIRTHSPTAVLAPTLPGLRVQYAEVVHTAQDFQRGPTYTHALTDPSGAATTGRRRHVQPLLPTSFSHGQEIPKAMTRF
jgi:hypothetical protein